MPAPDRSRALDHIVVVLFENRSLDNVLGHLYGPGDGKTFDGVIGKDLSNPIPAWAEHGADRQVVPYTVATDMDSPNPDSGEEYYHTNTQLYGVLDDHNRFKLGEAVTAPWNVPPPGVVPTMDGFVADYIATFTGEMGRQPTGHGDYHPAFGRSFSAEVDLKMDSPSSMLGGEAFLERVFNTYRSATSETGANVWNTALLIGWDEPGGTYDHVPPGPVPPPYPAAPAGEFGFTFDRSGYRVPAIIVSPWVEPGSVYNEEYRHPSLIATLRKTWGLGEAFTGRDASARLAVDDWAAEALDGLADKTVRLQVDLLRPVTMLIGNVPLRGLRAQDVRRARSSGRRLQVTRAVSSQGGLMAAGIKIHLGHIHRGKVVTVVIKDSQFRIRHDGTRLAAHP